MRDVNKDGDVFSLLALVLRLLGCDRPPASNGGAAPLKCYYDVEPELVTRQQEFRRMRKSARDSSYNSLSSLDTVVDYLQRRIEVKFGLLGHRGTVDSFEEAYHHIAFDDGTERVVTPPTHVPIYDAAGGLYMWLVPYNQPPQQSAGLERS